MAFTDNVQLNPVGEASPVTRLPDGRLRLTRKWEVTVDFWMPAALKALLFVAEGTADGSLSAIFPSTTQNPAGTATKYFPQCQLIGQTLDEIKGQAGKGILTQTYEELPAYPTETDAPSFDDIKDTNKGIVVIATTGTIAIGTNKLTVASLGNWAVGAQVNVAGAITAATIQAIDSTGLVWTLSATASGNATNAAVTGVSTSLGGNTVVGYFRQAREFKVKLIVAGLGSNFTIAKSTAYFATIPTGVPNRFFIGQTVEQHGTVFANIIRIYRELPDNKVFNRWIEFTVPGNILAGTQPPTTTKALATITESYTLTDQGPSALSYVPIRWATVTTTLVPSNGGSNVVTTQYFEGYLGSGTILNSTVPGTFNGVDYDTITQVSASLYSKNTASAPAATDYPSGYTATIASDVEYWNGNKRMGEIGEMCRKVDTQVTFL